MNPKKSLNLILVLFIPCLFFIVGWGPERKTFTTENPAPYVTLNSIVNNPAHGDERNFVQIREADLPNSSYTDEIELETGKEYVVYTYFQNDAFPSLKNDERGIAKDVTLQAVLPSVVEVGKKESVYSLIRCSNSAPQEIWDDVVVYTEQPVVAVQYIPDSVTIHSYGGVNGEVLKLYGDDLIGDGVRLGGDRLNGELTGEEKYAGYVTYRIKVDTPAFVMVTQGVRLKGETKWNTEIEVNPGDEIEFIIEYRNVGTTIQKDVVIRNTVPNGFALVKDSGEIVNSENPDGLIISDPIKTDGINIGNYVPYTSASLYFTLKAPNGDQLKDGENIFIPKASVKTINGETVSNVIIHEKNKVTTNSVNKYWNIINETFPNTILSFILAVFVGPPLILYLSKKRKR